MSIGASLIKQLPIKNWLYTGIAALCILLATALIYSPFIPKSVNVTEGEIAKSTILSPRFIEFQTQTDKKKTKELQENRASLVEDIYTIDESIDKEVSGKITEIFTAISNKKKNPSTELTLAFSSPETIEKILSLPDSELSSLEYIAQKSARDVLYTGLRTIDEGTLSEAIRSTFSSLQLEPFETQFITDLLLHSLQPNLFVNDQETQLAITRALSAIKPFTTIYKESQPIVYKGEVITQDHIDALINLNLYGTKSNIKKMLGILFLCISLFFLLDRFTFYFNKKVHSKKKYFLLTGIVILLTISSGRILLNAHLFSQVFDFQFMIPISISAMILSLLVTPNVSLLSGTIIALGISVMYNNDFTLFLFLFLSNCAASFASYQKRNRTELILVGYIVGASNIVLVTIIGLFNEISQITWYGANILLGFGSGVLSSMITLAILPYLESLFTITTQQTLLEYSNLNHPLLKRLMMNAPGTYQHSLMVANLAEAAAEAIQADAVLCRVGAYYHDIGKMKRPLFFIENQFSGQNPHHTLSPRMSKIIIASHPKDGVEYAKKYKLPKILQDFMMEHHGTTLVSFFFEQALQTEDVQNKETTKDEFRYPGPKPQFKESGIVMLADSVEAAVRSLHKPTPSKIENMIDRIFNDKIEDGQFDNCPLNLKEIEIIRETFLSVFNGIHHSRIDYEEELEGIKDQFNDRQ